ncbi:MAG: tetratricopeptide repeat protein [Raineya sp.]|jgi:tetratricopeptide (TPR) repeat protein|nr:tetratricopeptide repeat protein [Raineya sp.]
MRIWGIILGFGAILAISSCKHYHNVTAHYNGYFLANQKMLEIEKKLFNERKDNFNRILFVYPPLDTNQLKSLKAEFDDCIKKAAFAIERHEQSNWTDDGYILVGKSRFYNREYQDAINTFKYVNGTSKDKITQQKALIELMRTYTEQKEFNDADMVKNYLRKMEVEKPNLAAYYQMQAHFYRIRKDYERTNKSLELAIPEMKKGEQKARLLFLQGQIYQRQKQNEKAFESYQAVLKNKPTYEIELQTQLAMLLTGDSAVVFSDKTERKLQKMLKDFKNQDFLDEIYYDLAMIELRRKNLSKSVELFQKSSQAKGSGGQKPYSYLRLAEIHFDRMRKYETAKLYYDSTIKQLPKDEEGYEKVAKRHEVLDEFIKYLRVAQFEDSLQRMAKMSENQLDEYLSTNLSNQIKAELERKKALEKAKKQAEANNQQPNKGTLQQERDRQNSEWYFDNLTQVEEGKREFRTKWGNRPLADNWRNLSRISNELDENTPKDLGNNKEQAIAEQEYIQKEIANRKQGIKVLLPKTPEQMEKSLLAWESASFNLAKIYHFQLEEWADAESTYLDIVKRMSKSQYEAEIYYLLYLLYNQQKNSSKAQEMKTTILEKYPSSLYAKLIENPNYLLENQAKDEAAQKEYAIIYMQMYEQRKFKETILALGELSKKYPNNTIPDKIEALRVICIGKTEERKKFEEEMEAFFKKYPDSKLMERFKEMNAAIEEKKP